MQSKSKVCIVSDAIPPIHSGAGLSAMKLAYRLHKKEMLGLVLTGTEQTFGEAGKIIMQGETDEKFLDTIHRVPSSGLSARTTGRNPILFFAGLVKVAIRIPFTLFRERKKFGVLHCFSPTWFSLFAILSAKMMRKRVVLEITRLDGDDPGYIAHHDRFRILYQRRLVQYFLADVLVCNSPALHDRCLQSRSISEERLRLIPRAFSRKLCQNNGKRVEYRRKLCIPDDALALLFIGGINYRKGIHILVDAVIPLTKEFPQLRIYIIGPDGKTASDRTYSKEIRQKVQKHNLSGHIRFTGFLADVYDYYKAADIFLLPSISEGLPNVIIEAMACGNVVLMNDLPGISDFLISNGEDGFILSNKPASYAMKIRELANDPDTRKRISDAARAKVSAIFDEDLIDRDYLNLYGQLSGLESMKAHPGPAR